MDTLGRATEIRLRDFTSAPMRAFHMTWFAFFSCFLAWFGLAPLMAVVRNELSLDKDQIGWCIIASVSATVFARLLFGWLCDRAGGLWQGGALFTGVPGLRNGERGRQRRPRREADD